MVIAFIGRSNGAGPVLSAQSTVPVITVPASAKDFPEDVWSSLRAPSKVPVMTVLEPANAVLAALQILSARNPRIYAQRARRDREPDGQHADASDAQPRIRQAFAATHRGHIRRVELRIFCGSFVEPWNPTSVNHPTDFHSISESPRWGRTQCPLRIPCFAAAMMLGRPLIAGGQQTAEEQADQRQRARQGRLHAGRACGSAATPCRTSRMC